MASSKPPVRPTIRALMEMIGTGPELDADVVAALSRLMGVKAGLRGLSSLFQPGYPGIRTFVVEVRAAPDQAVEFTLVGIARNGAPVWSGARAFAFGRDGSLEIHRGFDEIAPEYQSRNITVDLIQRELDILALVDRGAASRLTIDAEGVGRYVCALHGFEFADETAEGPPVRSRRALEPAGDRSRLIEASLGFTERFAKAHDAGRIAIEAAADQFTRCETPWDFARVSLSGTVREIAEGSDGEMGVGELGRAFLLDEGTPGWRAALKLHSQNPRQDATGRDYRRRKTHRSEARLAQELQSAREALDSGNRTHRNRAIERLGMIAPRWVAPELVVVAEGPDRRSAALARKALARIKDQNLAEEMLAYASDERNTVQQRAFAYRVLAEHFPASLDARLPMLRVHPDARIQRAAIPLIKRAGPEEAPAAAALLAANPWSEGEYDRPGLEELRLELIECLARWREPTTLPVLISAYRASLPPSPNELLALSRALVGFPDPRAQGALREAARRLQRPEIP